MKNEKENTEKAGEETRKVRARKHIWELIDGPGVKVDRFSPDNDDAVRMMENLAAQPKVRTRVSREAKEPQGSFATVILDSVRINILKGIAVDLPEQVSNEIEKSQYQTEQAMSPIINNPFSGKPTHMRMDEKSDAEVAQL